MGITDNEILEIVSKHLSDKEKEHSIIYWNKKLLEAGDRAKTGRKATQMPFRGYMVFVDLMPKANWGHPALYFLVDIETHDVKIIKSEFPPYFEKYPEDFRVIQRYGKKPPHDRYFAVFDEENEMEG